MARYHKSSRRMESNPVPNRTDENKHALGGDKYGHYGDSAMIHEDKGAPALLPQHVIEKYYPARGYHLGMAPRDLFSGVQMQLEEDGSDMRKEHKAKKY